MIAQTAALVAAYLLLCVAVAYMGRRRKWGYWGYLWSSVIFTPVFGLLFILAADAPRKRINDAREADDE